MEADGPGQAGVRQSGLEAADDVALEQRGAEVGREHQPVVQVHIGPAQAEQLALPAAGVDRQRPQRGKSIARSRRPIHQRRELRRTWWVDIVLRHSRRVRGVGFELDPSIFELTRRNLAALALPLELLHTDYQTGLGQLSLPPDQLVVAFIAPRCDMRLSDAERGGESIATS